MMSKIPGLKNLANANQLSKMLKLGGDGKAPGHKA